METWPHVNLFQVGGRSTCSGPQNQEKWEHVPRVCWVASFGRPPRAVWRAGRFKAALDPVMTLSWVPRAVVNSHGRLRLQGCLPLGVWLDPKVTLFTMVRFCNYRAGMHKNAPTSTE